MLTPARRAHLVQIGRMGGYRTAATIDTAARARAGQRALRRTFLAGHGCRLCPKVVIPPSSTDKERTARADALYRLHMLRVARAGRA